MAKFILELGLKITRIQEFIQFFPMKCFDELSKKIVQNRRLGDIDLNKKVLAMTSKLCGNSLYSATLLNRSKHRAVTYLTDSNINEAINNPRFSQLKQLKPGLYEVKSLKKQIKHNLSVQLDISVYLEAKIHIFKFFYHFLVKYILKKCYSLIESDADSLYFSISRDSSDDCVLQHFKEKYFREKRKYMPAECCDECLNKFIDVRVPRGIWTPPPCCQKRNAFDTRVLGLMKTEYEGEKAVALTCKTYFCQGKSKKQVCKGVSIRQNPSAFEKYFLAFDSMQPLTVVDRGSITPKHNILTCHQEKRGLSPFLLQTGCLSRRNSHISPRFIILLYNRLIYVKSLGWIHFFFLIHWFEK